MSRLIPTLFLLFSFKSFAVIGVGKPTMSTEVIQKIRSLYFEELGEEIGENDFSLNSTIFYDWVYNHPLQYGSYFRLSDFKHAVKRKTDKINGWRIVRKYKNQKIELARVLFKIMIGSYGIRDMGSLYWALIYLSQDLGQTESLAYLEMQDFQLKKIMTLEDDQNLDIKMMENIERVKNSSSGCFHVSMFFKDKNKKI